MKYIRSRKLYSFYVIIVVIFGLASRRFGELLPELVASYAGDILWGLMIYLITGFILTKAKPIQITLVAVAFSYLIEFSQLYHASWIDAIRQTVIGGLVLGYGFLWSDLLCYTVGIVFGVLIETIVDIFKRR